MTTSASVEQLGVVKWFGDEQTGGKYGFVTDMVGVDHFFHLKNILVDNYRPKEGDALFFQLILSDRKPGSLDAVKIRPLSSISDVDVLIDTYVSCINKKNRLQIELTVARRIGTLSTVEEKKAILRRVWAKCSSEESATLDNLDTITPFISVVFPEDQKAVLGLLIENAPVEHRFNLWRNGTIAWHDDFAPLYCKDWSKLPPEEDAIEDKHTFGHYLTPWQQGPRRKWSDYDRTTVDLLERAVPDISLLTLYRALAESICIGETKCCITTLDILLKVNSGKIELRNSVVEVVKSSPNGTLRVFLWIRDIIEMPQKEDFLDAAAKLPPEEQQNCFKKMIYVPSGQQKMFEPRDVCSLPWVDLTTRVVCAAIHARLNNARFGEQEIYSAIVSCLNKPETALELNGFFDQCMGRAYCVQTENDIEALDNPTDVDITVRRGDMPKFITYCEGHLAVDRMSGEAVLDKRFKRKFWFCGNQVCFDNCVRTDLPDTWRAITLYHVMHLCGVSPQIKEYEILLGTLNRVKRILEHMKCSECGHILHPDGQSSYAFHRVTRFKCQNPKCSSKDVIYLNHCLNRDCRNVVDSRNSAKCRPEGHDQNLCGWYICDYCLACCSTETLLRRKEILERMNGEWKCHTEGHLDREEICCVKCGTVLETVGGPDSVKKIIEWLDRNKDDKTKIAKYGNRKDGTRWFLVRSAVAKSKEDFDKWILRLESLGFSVPDARTSKPTQLVGEPQHAAGINFRCKSCGYQLDVGSVAANHDYARLSALRYHKKVERALPRPNFTK